MESRVSDLVNVSLAAAFFANSNFDAVSFAPPEAPSSFVVDAFGKTGVSPFALTDFLLLNNE